MPELELEVESVAPVAKTFDDFGGSPAQADERDRGVMFAEVFGPCEEA